MSHIKVVVYDITELELGMGQRKVVLLSPNEDSSEQEMKAVWHGFWLLDFYGDKFLVNKESSCPK